MKFPTDVPITAPTTGIGINTSPNNAETALTPASIQHTSEFIIKSSFVISPFVYLTAFATVPKAAVTIADATFAGVQVKFVIP